MISTQKAAKLSLCLFTLFVASTAVQAGYHHKWTIFPERSGTRVLTSIPQLADVAKKIGGRRVSVVSLLKPKADFHSPKITKSMAKAMNEADVLLRLSPSLDPWVDELAKQCSNQRLRTETGAGDACVEITPSQQVRDLDSLLRDKQTAQTVARVVLATLVRTDPKNESYYRANSDVSCAHSLIRHRLSQARGSRKDCSTR